MSECECCGHAATKLMLCDTCHAANEALWLEFTGRTLSAAKARDEELKVAAVAALVVAKAEMGHMTRHIERQTKELHRQRLRFEDSERDRIVEFAKVTAAKDQEIERLRARLFELSA